MGFRVLNLKAKLLLKMIPSVFLIASTSSCSKAATGEFHACYNEYLCSEDGSIVKWQSGSMALKYDNGVPQEIRDAIEDTSESYNDFLLNTSIDIMPENDRAPAAVGGNYLSLNGDGVNGVYYITGSWPWEKKIKGSLAVTLTRYSEKGISEIDIYIRANNLFTASQENEERSYMLRYLVAHELGHALGRGHSKNTDSLMYPSLPTSSFVDLAAMAMSSGDPLKGIFDTYDLSLFKTAY